MISVAKPAVILVLEHSLLRYDCFTSQIAGPIKLQGLKRLVACANFSHWSVRTFDCLVIWIYRFSLHAAPYLNQGHLASQASSDKIWLLL